jgi:NTE family protein
VFRPSEDIALLTSKFLREQSTRARLSPLWRALLGLKRRVDHQALLASILFLDGRLAARLIELGRRDAHTQREQILAFFEQP